eukprot:TRINITY_DN2012_c0_g1_i1.p1 TRINITY_DN2012_c0_g1~~TRINITY_DN2012_c0_g1_i1.p1  ORF type:complete len:413 (+),score=42.33 TRINITY_DN2012_c0_g1_i1:56-1294(+)
MVRSSLTQPRCRWRLPFFSYALLFLFCGRQPQLAPAMRGRAYPEANTRSRRFAKKNRTKNHTHTVRKLILHNKSIPPESSSLATLESFVNSSSLATLESFVQVTLKQRAGSSAVFVGLFIFVMAIVGVGGYYYYQERRRAAARRERKAVTFDFRSKSSEAIEEEAEAESDEHSEENISLPIPKKSHSPKHGPKGSVATKSALSPHHSHSPKISHGNSKESEALKAESPKHPSRSRSGTSDLEGEHSSRARAVTADIHDIARSTPKACVETLREYAQKLRVETKKSRKYGTGIFHAKDQDRYFAAVPAEDTKVAADDWVKQLQLWQRGRLAYWQDYEAFASKSAEKGHVPLKAILRVDRQAITPREVMVTHSVEGEGYEMALHFTRERAAEEWCHALTALVKLLQALQATTHR